MPSCSSACSNQSSPAGPGILQGGVRGGPCPGGGCLPEGCKGGSALLPQPEAADNDMHMSTLATKASMRFAGRSAGDLPW